MSGSGRFTRDRRWNRGLRHPASFILLALRYGAPQIN